MSEAVLDQASASALARQLERSFSGYVLTAGEHGCDDARTIWTAMVDKKPALIAWCASARDVVASVNLARQHKLPVSVRCGGHGVTGKVIADGRLTIDLTPMRRSRRPGPIRPPGQGQSAVRPGQLLPREQRCHRSCHRAEWRYEPKEESHG